MEGGDRHANRHQDWRRSAPPPPSMGERQQGHRRGRGSEHGERHEAPRETFRPRPSLSTSPATLHSYTSFHTLSLTYAMMDEIISMEAEHETGGDAVDFVAVVDQAIAPAEPTGPSDVSDAPAPVPAR